MNILLKKIQSFIRKSVNLIIEFENKEKIRDDYIEIYRACVIQDDNPLRPSFFSQNFRYYHERLLYWRLRAKNLDVNSSTKNIEEIVDAGESISDLFTLIDSFLTIVAVLTPTLLIISIIEKWHPIISLVFLFFAVLIIFLKLYVRLLFFFSDEICYLNKNLVITQDDVKYGSKYYGKKDSIIAAYIWNHSLCNYSIIISIIILLAMKVISKKIYTKIYESMVRIIPLYMPEFIKNKSRIKFLKFVITHQGK